MDLNIDEEEIIERSMNRLAKIKIKMDQPERWTEEDARYVFEDVNHEMRSRVISADKDRRMQKISEEKKIGREFEKAKKEINENVNNTQKEEPANVEQEPTKKLEFKHKYKFSQKPGHATNKQLSFIQELRDKNNAKLLEIDVDIENVPKMSFDDANKEIRRLKKELGWKPKESDQK